jgi:hypothetical protein
MERGPNIIIDMNKDKVISNSQLLSSSLKGFKDKNIITTNNMPSWLLTNISGMY